MKKISLALALLFAATYISCAQTTFGRVARFDRTVHDFGDICTADGPVSCSYSVKNVGGKPLTILSVVSSCGCTAVTWTKESIPEGKSGEIKATFKNEDGPVPFDKSLTVYLSDVRDPVVLHLRGVVHEKALPLEEAYPVHFGPFALKDSDIKCGNLSQGQQKSGEVMVANIGDRSINVAFKGVSDNLSIRVEPNPVPARSTARLIFTVTADRTLWGRNYYWATPLVDGKVLSASVPESLVETPKGAGAEALYSERDSRLMDGGTLLGVWAITKEDFSSLTRDEKKLCANPMFTCSTFSFGSVKSGTKVKAKFEFSNVGKSDLRIYKIDCETSKVSVKVPEETFAPGAKGGFTAVLDTSKMPKGEVLISLMLITNSPLRPVVTLYISGFIV